MSLNVKEGTLIHGTMRNADLIPTFLKALSDTDDYIDLLEEVPADAWEKDENGEVVKVNGERKPDESNEFWDSGDAIEVANDLIDALCDNAPDGMYFGTTEGDGSDYGFWKIDDDDDNSELDHEKESLFNDIYSNAHLREFNTDRFVIIKKGTNKPYSDEFDTRDEADAELAKKPAEIRDMFKVVYTKELDTTK